MGNDQKTRQGGTIWAYYTYLLISLSLSLSLSLSIICLPLHTPAPQKLVTWMSCNQLMEIVSWCYGAMKMLFLSVDSQCFHQVGTKDKSMSTEHWSTPHTQHTHTHARTHGRTHTHTSVSSLHLHLFPSLTLLVSPHIFLATQSSHGFHLNQLNFFSPVPDVCQLWQALPDFTSRKAPVVPTQCKWTFVRIRVVSVRFVACRLWNTSRSGTTGKSARCVRDTSNALNYLGRRTKNVMALIQVNVKGRGFITIAQRRVPNTAASESQP